ncbi:MAG TPA: polymorphic toxin-type HINT domain-containing protein [Ktedonobacteraceae bacterium]|nr:polymorphic toxin-type HINT domain-containing protein [Ktedonobacteraceae bacterium]
MAVTLVATVKGPHRKATQQKEVLHTNEKHPFLTKEKGFIPISQLQLGMHVLRADGSYGVVARLTVVPGTQAMYNLTVAQDHTYAVGTEQWIVHNCNVTFSDNTPDTCSVMKMSIYHDIPDNRQLLIDAASGDSHFSEWISTVIHGTLKRQVVANRSGS